MNDTTENNAVDWSDLSREQKVEMNWKLAHSILLVANEMLDTKLSNGEEPEAEDYMTPISIAVSALSDEYSPQELCQMMSALAAMMRVKETVLKQNEQEMH